MRAMEIRKKASLERILSLDFNFSYVCLCVHVCVEGSMHDCRCLQRSEKSVGSSRTEVIGGCESSHMGARRQN